MYLNVPIDDILRLIVITCNFQSLQASAAVTLMVDACGKSDGISQINGLEYSPVLTDCLFTLSHNLGVDRALNVDQWPLQLGGRKVNNLNSLYPNVLTTNSLPAGSAFRHVLVNGELWNLAQWGPSSNVLPASPACLDRKNQDICAPNVSIKFYLYLAEEERVMKRIKGLHLEVFLLAFF